MSFKKWSAGLKTPAKNNVPNKSQAIMPSAKQAGTPDAKAAAEDRAAANVTRGSTPDEGGES